MVYRNTGSAILLSDILTSVFGTMAGNGRSYFRLLPSLKILHTQSCASWTSGDVKKEYFPGITMSHKLLDMKQIVQEKNYANISTMRFPEC